ncbi:MAG: tandem-95 repeat protein, partial [bacterium]|nr:tandem-95 repeat protein [bacterium]
MAITATVVTDEDVAVPITLQASDAEGDALSYTVNNLPTSGVLSGAAPNLIYTPNSNFNGSDSFNFTVDDGNGGSDTATISITVSPANDPPVAVATTVATDEDVAVAITLQASDVDGDALNYSVTSPSTNGGLSGTVPNLTYTPNAGFTGSDSFTFQVEDGNGGTDTASVSITVNPAAAGLVAYWPMNETTGTSTADASGNGHHGTLVGGTSWTTRVPGVTFSGANSYIDVGNLHVTGSAITLAAFVRSDDLGKCPYYNDCRVISKSSGSSSDDHYFMLSTFSSDGGVTTSIRFRLKTAGNTTTLIADSGSIANNQWNHVAAVYDGTTMRL